MLRPLLPAVPAWPEQPPGFLRQLIESRLLAIVLGLTALVGIGLWLAWQLSAVRGSGSGEPPSGSDSSP